MKYDAQAIASAIAADPRTGGVHVEVGPSNVQQSLHEYVFVYPQGVPLTEEDAYPHVVVSEESEYDSDAAGVLIGTHVGEEDMISLASVFTLEGLLGEVAGTLRSLRQLGL